jgi:hypothetical protein
VSQESYEQEEFEKVMTVLRAARQNSVCQGDITISTSGDSPSASVTIAGYVMEKFLKKPKGTGQVPEDRK